MSADRIELLGDLLWTCRCEDQLPDPETRILEIWTCPWCGSKWQVVEHFPNDIPHWWRLR